MNREVHPPATSPDMWAHDAVLPVAVMVAAPAPEHAADPMLWKIAGVVVGRQFASATRQSQCVRSGPNGALYLWRGFSIRLHPAQADDYALNLGSEEPEVFVIARFDAERGVEPLEITVSLDHAQNLDATELRASNEMVLSTSMPAELGRWMETFILEHYRPRKKSGRGKRRSKALYDAAVGDWDGADTP